MQNSQENEELQNFEIDENSDINMGIIELNINCKYYPFHAFFEWIAFVELLDTKFLTAENQRLEETETTIEYFKIASLLSQLDYDSCRTRFSLVKKSDIPESKREGKSWLKLHELISNVNKIMNSI